MIERSVIFSIFFLDKYDNFKCLNVSLITPSNLSSDPKYYIQTLLSLVLIAIMKNPFNTSSFSFIPSLSLLICFPTGL